MATEAMVTVPASLLQRMVGFVEKSGKLVEQVAKDQELAKQAAPEAAALLVQKGLLTGDQQEKAAAALGTSHAKAVEILRRTVTHIGTEKSAAALPSMGVPAGSHSTAGNAGEASSQDDAGSKFLQALGF
ncbi:MAG TPA: hypothetical protein VM487_11730 [Phycisphaerae bacterium]|nr:hypothetical protein [Phycisphaerae bacterium]